MGLGNEKTLSDFTEGNLNLQAHDEKIIITSCNGCYNYLIRSNHTNTDITIILDIQNKKDEYNAIKPFVLHAIEYISTWSSMISTQVMYPLTGLQFALHYGCHYINQYRMSNQVTFRKLYATDKKNISWHYNSIPTYLKDIITPLGGRISNYGELITCCGGSTPQRQINLENSSSVALKKFSSLHNNPEIDAILTICPLCLYFLEDSQFLQELEGSFESKIPVMHINELIGLTLGNEKTIEALKSSHRISLDEIIEKIVNN
jgi:heterodisulfide reductase subunit B